MFFFCFVQHLPIICIWNYPDTVYVIRIQTAQVVMRQRFSIYFCYLPMLILWDVWIKKKTLCIDAIKTFQNGLAKEQQSISLKIWRFQAQFETLLSFIRIIVIVFVKKHRKTKKKMLNSLQKFTWNLKNYHVARWRRAVC